LKGSIKTIYFACLFLLIVITNTGCQSGDKKAAISQGLKIDQKIKVGSLKREYDLFEPHGLSLGRKYPLVISLHGHGGSKEYNSGTSGKKSPHKVFRDVGEREKFFVAYPQGEKGGDDKRGWNECRADAKSNPDTDDTAFISQLIDHLIREYPIDPRRVYVVGTSNGGGMAVRLAIDIPDKLAAVASIVFTGAANSECPMPKKPVSILFMNGTEDPFAPYNGGKVGKDKFERGTVLSVKQVVDLWLTANRIKNKTPKVTQIPDRDADDDTHVEVYTYSGGQRGTEVVHYKVIGGGHVEPSLKERMGWIWIKIVGKQNNDMEMAEEIWKFFKNNVSK
jgi:polyhydroxybutyrate depolymerase